MGISHNRGSDNKDHYIHIHIYIYICIGFVASFSVGGGILLFGGPVMHEWCAALNPTVLKTHQGPSGGPGGEGGGQKRPCRAGQIHDERSCVPQTLCANHPTMVNNIWSPRLRIPRNGP